MTKLLAVVAIALFFATLAPRAHAQLLMTTYKPAPVPIFIDEIYPGAPPFPYSYKAVSPYMARDYIGYGKNDFPFYGRPYGSPSDKWSWAAMGGTDAAYLTRYYYEPLR